MVDDPLFPQNADPPTPPPRANGDPPKEPSGGDRPMTVNDVTAIVEQLVQPNTEQMGRITQNQSEMTETLRGMQDALGRLGVPPGGEGDAPLDPTSFLTNPEESVRGIVKDEVGAVLKEQIAPILSRQVEQNHEEVVSSLREDINQTYGDGTWEKEFAPELNPLFEQTKRDAPSRLGDKAAIRKTVDAVKGMKFEVLMKAKEANDAAKQQAAEDEQAAQLKLVTSNLPAGLTRTTSASALSEEGREFLKTIMSATGEAVDEKGFMASLNSGPTYKEWKAAQEKK